MGTVPTTPQVASPDAVCLCEFVTQADVASERKHADDARISFICCIEAGVLEEMALRLVESLRRFGGRFSKSPVIAVTPRFGPPLRQSTHRRLEDLGVEYLRVSLDSRFSWLHYMNREVALVHGEARAATELVSYLDADTLILREPEALDLPAGIDFGASYSDTKVGATTGPSDPHDEAWRAICDVEGISIDGLPWITTSLDRTRIRLYFQGGILVYRRSIQLGRKLQDLLIAVLDNHIRLPGSAWTFVDQTLPGPILVKNDYRWVELPFDHNYTMASYLPQYYDQESFREARIVHYHDSMAPHFWPAFLERLDRTHPEVAHWLRPLGALANESPAYWKALSETLRMQRGIRRRLHMRKAARS